MEPGNGGMSSVEIVRQFLESLDGRQPRPEEIRRIRPALDDLVAKITRLHQIAPAYGRATLSEEVKALVRLAHDPAGPEWLRIAALF
ncbi:MAG: hypothetical protein HYY16_05305 [Planctomycetes bacterium]|nr:hypothetical protein [Planctomycetota bacterium]